MELNLNRIVFLTMVSAAGWLMASLPLLSLVHAITTAIAKLGV